MTATAAALMGPAVLMPCASTPGTLLDKGSLQLFVVLDNRLQALQWWGGPVHLLYTRGGWGP